MFGEKERFWWSLSERKYLMRNYSEQRNKSHALFAILKKSACLS